MSAQSIFDYQYHRIEKIIQTRLEKKSGPNIKRRWEVRNKRTQPNHEIGLHAAEKYDTVRKNTHDHLRQYADENNLDIREVYCIFYNLVEKNILSQYEHAFSLKNLPEGYKTTKFTWLIDMEIIEECYALAKFSFRLKPKQKRPLSVEEEIDVF